MKSPREEVPATRRAALPFSASLLSGHCGRHGTRSSCAPASRKAITAFSRLRAAQCPSPETPLLSGQIPALCFGGRIGDRQSSVRHPHDAVGEHGTYGGQGKAVVVTPSAALLCLTAVMRRSYPSRVEPSASYAATTRTPRVEDFADRHFTAGSIAQAKARPSAPHLAALLSQQLTGFQ